MPGAANHFEIRERLVHGHLRLSLLGELDLSSAGALEERLDELRRSRIEVWLDLSRLDRIDTTGLRVLTSAALHARAAGWRFNIEGNLSRPVRRVFELTGAVALILGGPEAEEYLSGLRAIEGR